MTNAKITDFNGTPCVELSAGGYTCLIAYEIGCNVIRLRDCEKKVEFFRFDENNPAEVIKNSPEVWGMPTLYFPNRLSDGILQTSDHVYTLPVNEKNHYNNYIHGFVHKRAHKVAEYSCDENSAWAKTVFEYDENDEYFVHFPVKFRVEYTFTLSENGLEQKICYTNLSDSVLPVSIGSHTAIKAPFVDGAKQEDIRLKVPALKRCELNQRCLPTEKLLPLSPWDQQFPDGTLTPVLQSVDNDMYLCGRTMLNGKEFHGAVMEDTASGIKLCYEVSEEYKFWIMWNEGGSKGYFCPEPMTAMIDAPNLSISPVISGYREISKNEKFEVMQHFFACR